MTKNELYHKLMELKESQDQWFFIDPTGEEHMIRFGWWEPLETDDGEVHLMFAFFKREWVFDGKNFAGSDDEFLEFVWEKVFESEGVKK